jgi:hypothetical protein
VTEKAAFLKKFNEAFARSDTDFIVQNVTEDIRWTIIGDCVIQGKEEFARALREMESDHPLKLTIDNIITHGKTAAVNGTMETSGASSKGKIYAFCDVYVFNGFKNPKIREMTSYVLEVEQD